MVTAKYPISLKQMVALVVIFVENRVQILIGHLKLLAGEERTWIH